MEREAKDSRNCVTRSINRALRETGLRNGRLHTRSRERPLAASHNRALHLPARPVAMLSETLSTVPFKGTIGI
jgi:hypothetical protein